MNRRRADLLFVLKVTAVTLAIYLAVWVFLELINLLDL